MVTVTATPFAVGSTDALDHQAECDDIPMWLQRIIRLSVVFDGPQAAETSRHRGLIADRKMRLRMFRRSLIHRMFAIETYYHIA